MGVQQANSRWGVGFTPSQVLAPQEGLKIVCPMDAWRQLWGHHCLGKTTWHYVVQGKVCVPLQLVVLSLGTDALEEPVRWRQGCWEQQLKEEEEMF